MRKYLLPPSALIPADKEDPADKPVDGHSNPDTEDSHMEHHGQQVAETKPEHPHGDDGEHHGDLHIRRGAQRIRQREGQRPDRHNAGSMIQDNIVCILGGLVGEIVDRQDKRQRRITMRFDAIRQRYSTRIICFV